VHGDLIEGTFEATNASERTIRHLSIMFATRDESGYYGGTGAEHQEYAVRIPPKRSAIKPFEDYVGNFGPHYRGVECVIENITFHDGSMWARKRPMIWP